MTNKKTSVYQEGVDVPNRPYNKEDCDHHLKSKNCQLPGGHHEDGDDHDDRDKVFVVPTGAYQWISPDCFYVFVRYSAGFDGTLIEEQEIRKIRDCRPYYHSDCQGTGASKDRNGNECTDHQ